MQPTTNTPFERFAFAAVIALTIVFPIVLVGLVVLLATTGTDYPFVTGWISAIGFVFLAFSIPVFSIICAVKIESDHVNALTKAEAELSDIVVSDMKTLPPNWKPINTVFIAENVVLANDYLKAFFWSFRKLVGGESSSFSKLFARARREATVRVLRKAREHGANVVWNIRFETCTLQSNKAKSGKSQTATGVEVLAYATAFNVTSSTPNS